MEQIVKAATAAQIEAAAIAAKAQSPAKQIVPGNLQTQKIVELLIPIEHNETVWSSLTLRRLKGRDLINLRNIGDDEQAGLLAIMTGAPVAVINELDLDDFTNLVEAAQDFLPHVFKASASTPATSAE